MARKGKLKILIRISVTVLCVSFLSLYFAFWNSANHAKSTSFLFNFNTNLKSRTNVLPTSDYDGQASVDKQPTYGSLQHRERNKELVLTLVVCGDRFNESLVVIKSAIAFTMSTSLYLIIITEEALMQKFHLQFSNWPEDVVKHVRVSIRPLSFPQDGTAEEWKNLFKLCACQRLFIPSLLTDIDATIYVDTDIVFLRPLDDIWQFFDQMNSSQLAAMSPEHEDYATGWYNRFAQHPYFKPLGVNSGVMLMNLTRMRAFDWNSRLKPIYDKYKQKITWGDQDILNILFHNHPEKLYVYPCEWNYRSDHCMYTSVCKSAEKNGVATVHGNRAVFHSNKQPAFKAIYDTFEQFNLGENLKKRLLEPLRRNLKLTANTSCGKLYPIFLRHLEKYILDVR